MEFESALESARKEIEQTLLSCVSEVAGSEARAENCLKRLNGLKAFRKAMARLEDGKSDPLSLPQARDRERAPLPNIYVLKAGDWTGYYRLDPAARLGVAMLAFNKKPSADLLEPLLEAIRKYGAEESSPAGKKGGNG